jgi:uncharacterized membrane protein
MNSFLRRKDLSARPPPARLHLVDAARGTALVAMLIYHFAWDLNYFELISAEMGEGGAAGWVLFARLTAGSFLFLVGLSLVLADRSGLRIRAFMYRVGLIAGTAVLLTAITLWLTPEEFIYFGILHCIAVSSVLGLPFLRLPIWIVLVVACICFAAPSLLAGPAFDGPAVRWLGLMSYFPETSDYEPLLPWFGVVLLGIAAARIALPLWGAAACAAWKPGTGASRLLTWAGRHSLGIYILHQPLLLTGVYLLANMRAWA